MIIVILALVLAFWGLATLLKKATPHLKKSVEKMNEWNAKMDEEKRLKKEAKKKRKNES